MINQSVAAAQLPADMLALMWTDSSFTALMVIFILLFVCVACFNPLQSKILAVFYHDERFPGFTFSLCFLESEENEWTKRSRRRRAILYFSIFYILPDVCTLEQEAVTSL